MTRGAGSRAKAAGLGPCSVRPGEAWREQRLSCFSSSMPIMSKGTEEAPNSGEPGESTVSLHAAPRCWAQGCWGSACGWEGRKGRAEATQCCGQAGSSRFLARGHSLGRGCPLAPVGLQCPLPLHPPSPAPQLARQARSRPWGRPPRTPGPARCSLLLTLALSFLSSVRAVPPGTGQPGHLRGDICQRWALCPPVLLGEFPQGLGLLPGVLPSFLSGLTRSCPFLSYSSLPMAFWNGEAQWGEFLASPSVLSSAQSSWQSRR